MIHRLRFLFIILSVWAVLPVCSQTIAFSMAEEAAQQNTPTGWNAVQLPTGLPEFTSANTFYITNYGASTSSADNTAAIQAALDAAYNAGGGMVVVPAGTWMFGRIEIGSKTVLHICANATLKLLSYDNLSHTDKTPFIKGKSNAASDIVIEGESRETSIIDGQGGPWWDHYKDDGLQRGAMIRFAQGNRYLFRNFRIQNAPGTNLTIGDGGKGAHATVHDITIKNPSSEASDPSHNTDGIPIWTQYVNIYNCEIDTGDDNVVTDSKAQFVHVWNCDFKEGHGASLGSYTVDMHDIIYEDITFTGTDSGFRLKSNKGRSGDVYNLIFRNCTMTNVANPISITCWYDSLPASPQAAESWNEQLLEDTPQFHDILIQNVTASGHTTYKSGNSNAIKDRKYFGIFIYGRPESYVRNVTFDNVDIKHSKGVRMVFCEGINFINNCKYEVYNTNNTSLNTTAGEDLSNVLQNCYKYAYTWNGNDAAQVTTSTLNGTTNISANNTSSSWAFNDGYTITNNNSKEYATGNSNTIKYSKGVQYTINIPSGKAVKSISFTGYSNHNTDGCYLSEVNGTTYGSTVYTFQNRTVLNNSSLYETRTINFTSPVTGELTFTVGGAQACLSIALTTKGLTATNVSLLDSKSNAATMLMYDSKYANVTLSGRTIYKDGSWNTLCLPFAVSDFTGTPLQDATVMTLSNASFSGGTLTLNFVGVTEMEAGKPYIVKWETPADNLVNPTFDNVVITGGTEDIQTSVVDFVGITSPLTFEANDKTVLYLGNSNNLYYPNSSMTINSCRAYFRLNGITAGDIEQQGGRIILNFIDDDKMITGIKDIENGKSGVDNDTWYTLDGRKLLDKPTRRGVYIHGGKKIVVK